MYIPAKLKMSETRETHDFIDEFGFAVLVSEPLLGSHLPFLLNRDEGECGVLYAHCAKANPHWKALAGTQAMVIFSGPHAYISPTWYAKAPAVPTWNYAAVHAYGVASLLDDNQTLEVVQRLVKKYEPSLMDNKTVLADDNVEKLLSSIVGFKITLNRLDGKLKLGQHRRPADQTGVYQALSTSLNHDDQALAQYMKKLNLGLGN
ncbi:MAG: transcriptional regulator [Paraglaciecola sp.]|jgi:transcriptional regulator